MKSVRQIMATSHMTCYAFMYSTMQHLQRLSTYSEHEKKHEIVEVMTVLELKDSIISII